MRVLVASILCWTMTTASAQTLDEWRAIYADLRILTEVSRQERDNLEEALRASEQVWRENALKTIEAWQQIQEMETAEELLRQASIEDDISRRITEACRGLLTEDPLTALTRLECVEAFRAHGVE